MISFFVMPLGMGFYYFLASKLIEDFDKKRDLNYFRPYIVGGFFALCMVILMLVAILIPMFA
jgi:hypothetical protein